MGKRSQLFYNHIANVHSRTQRVFRQYGKEADRLNTENNIATTETSQQIEDLLSRQGRYITEELRERATRCTKLKRNRKKKRTGTTERLQTNNWHIVSDVITEPNTFGLLPTDNPLENIRIYITSPENSDGETERSTEHSEDEEQTEKEKPKKKSISWANTILSVKEIPVVGRGLSKTEREIAKKRKSNTAKLAYKWKETISVTPAPCVANPNQNQAEKEIGTNNKMAAAAEYASFVNKHSTHMEVDNSEAKTAKKRKCHTCKKSISEEKFSMTCDENQRHLYCFLCCKISLEQQGKTAHCPSGNKCKAAGLTTPWTWDSETWEFVKFNTYEDHMEEINYLHKNLMREEENENKMNQPAEKPTFASIIADSIDNEENVKFDNKETEHTADHDISPKALNKDDKATTTADDELEAALVRVAIEDNTKTDSDDDTVMETSLSADTEDLRTEDEEENERTTEKGYM